MVNHPISRTSENIINSPENKGKIRILFVCLGNICRSPAAEGIMKHRVAEACLCDNFFIDSAGIGGWHVGQLPDHRMRRCGERHGYHFCSRARQFSPQDFDRFDCIIGMDRENVADLKAQARTPQDAKKVRLITEFMRQHPGQDTIPDPYYGSDFDFEWVIELLEDACQGLLEEVVTGR